MLSDFLNKSFVSIVYIFPFFCRKMVASKSVAPITGNGGNPPKTQDKIKVVGKDFLINSSMHGLKYIGEEERHICER